jgi:2,3-bisphosphoglycerate-independent phosphoglycerate mutase
MDNVTENYYILYIKANLLRDNVSKFDEISCSSGLLGRFGGAEVFNIIKNYRSCL